MKRLLFTCLLAISYFLTIGQTLVQNIKNRLLQTDSPGELFSVTLNNFNFSPLFLHTDNYVIYGFIGDNYQRLRMKFITVSKSGSAPGTYLVRGKSMVKNKICEFQGTITLSSIRKYKIPSYGVDSSYYNKGIKGQYVISGKYIFAENKNQAHSGIFRGVFQSNFYLDGNNKIHYDDIDMQSDGYTNNQFTGRWISYKSNLKKRCNWGDFRIPNSGDFDIGAGEFSPNAKDPALGWQTVVDLFGPKAKREKAKEIEEAEWWK